MPPVMQTYFDYGDQENSILYLLAGIELILVFLVLNVSSRCLSDRVLISGGLLLMLTAMTWLTATLPRFGPSDRTNIPYFAVGVILDLAGIPTVCDIGLSLYSKLLPSNMQVRSIPKKNKCNFLVWRSMIIVLYFNHSFCRHLYNNIIL